MINFVADNGVPKHLSITPDDLTQLQLEQMRDQELIDTVNLLGIHNSTESLIKKQHFDGSKEKSKLDGHISKSLNNMKGKLGIPKAEGVVGVHGALLMSP